MRTLDATAVEEPVTCGDTLTLNPRTDEETHWPCELEPDHTGSHRATHPAGAVYTWPNTNGDHQ